MAFGSKTKCQDKTLAIGSNQIKPTWDKTQHLLETLTRSVLARRDERKSQKHKTYGKNVYRFSIPKLIAESFSATVIFLPYFRKLISEYILTRADI